jgi:hypothetical protein
MTTSEKQPARLRNAATLVIASAMLSGAALYNRYPLVYPDSGSYLKVINFGIRSIFYSIFVYPARFSGTLWSVVFAQSLLVAGLLRLLVREVFAITSRVGFLIVIGLLCALSSLPWYCGYLMPDIFTPMTVLGLFMLAFCFARLSRRERVFVIGLTFVAEIVHYSHVPIAISLILIGLLSRLVLRNRALAVIPRLMLPATVVSAGLVAIVMSNYLMLGLVTYSPGSYAFEFARLVADGPAVEYLRATCPTRKYAACAYLDRMPMSSPDFLFAPDSLFKKTGWLGERKEGKEIVAATVRRYPLWILGNGITNTLTQAVTFQTGDGLASQATEPYPTTQLRALYPGDFAAYEDSRQSRGELSRMPHLKTLQWGLIIFSAIYCGLIAILLARDGHWLPVALMITVGFAIMINAFVAGAISEPANRYGSRVIWMLPLMAIASWRMAFGLSDSRDEQG